MAEPRASEAFASTDSLSAEDESSTARLTAAYREVRERSIALTAPLQIEDYGVQPMADASPPKWHLAHTTWFFETFVLKPFVPDHRPHHPAYEYLFNSYYNGIGEQFPRARRGELSRPTVAEVLAWREEVDAAMVRLLAQCASETFPPGRDARQAVLERTVLGLHHEEQHQELLVTDLKYAFGHNPLRPAHDGVAEVPAGSPVPLAFTRFDGGLVETGVALPPASGDRDCFVFDNETPAHRVWLEPFELADRCVTCGEFLAFMEDDGYRRPELWLADAWIWLEGDDGPRAPLYWEQDAAGGWREYTLAGMRDLDPHAPVCHVSFYEADAYARWMGLRLPREEEWEHAARSAGTGRFDSRHPDARPVDARHLDVPPEAFLEHGGLHPLPDVLDGPQPAAGKAVRGLFGNLWEWTASPYRPYPGYAPLPGALGEYNGKFMSNQMVLRGGSCATPAAHVRASYRNFFYPTARWQFTGVRLARDL